MSVVSIIQTDGPPVKNGPHYAISIVDAIHTIHFALAASSCNLFALIQLVMVCDGVVTKTSCSAPHKLQGARTQKICTTLQTDFLFDDMCERKWATVMVTGGWRAEGVRSRSER